MSLAAASLPIGTGVVLLSTSGPASATIPVFLDSNPPPANDTVTCNTALGFFKIAPALVSGGTSPAKVVIHATLEGCVDGFGVVNGGLPFYGFALGLLRTTSNNITNLSGANALSCLHGPTFVHAAAIIPCGYNARVDTSGNSWTAGSVTVTDPNIQAGDLHDPVTGAGFVNPSYVGSVNPGVSFTVSSSPTSQVDQPPIKSKTGYALDVYGFDPTYVYGTPAPTNPYGYLTVQWMNARTLKLSTATFGGEVSVPTCTYGNSDAIDGFGDFSDAAGGYADQSYGEFVVGHEALAPPTAPTAGCTTVEYTTAQALGGFPGTDSGATSTLVAMTANDAASLLFGQENPAPTVSQITLGPSVVYFG